MILMHLKICPSFLVAASGVRLKVKLKLETWSSSVLSLVWLAVQQWVVPTHSVLRVWYFPADHLLQK